MNKIKGNKSLNHSILLYGSMSGSPLNANIRLSIQRYIFPDNHFLDIFILICFKAGFNSQKTSCVNPLTSVYMLIEYTRLVLWWQSVVSLRLHISKIHRKMKFIPYYSNSVIKTERHQSWYQNNAEITILRLFIGCNKEYAFDHLNSLHKTA